MKKSSKIIALCLVLAIVSSLFVIIGTADDSQPTVIYDSNKTAFSSTQLKVGYEIEKVKDDNGNEYYKLTSKATESKGADGYYRMSVGAKGVIDSASAHGDKNTDFFVIDFDMATETFLKTDARIQARFYKGSSSKQNGHVTLGKGLFDNAYHAFDSKGANTVMPLSTVLESDWVDVTVIYDVRNPSKNSRAYVYLNGVYAGSQTFMSDGATELQEIRFLSSGSVAKHENETILIDNITLKAYPVGYSGDLTKVASAMPLQAYSDLAYCLENKPVTTVATIERGEATIPVYGVQSLEDMLQPGDKVTLKRNVVRPTVIPEGVTFVDNGFTCAVNEEAAVQDVDFIVRNVNGEIVAQGKQEYDNDGNLVTDNLGLTLSATTTKSYYITLYNDVKFNNNDKMIKLGATYVFDLNGHTLTGGRSGHCFVLQDGGQLVFKNGSLKNTTSFIQSTGASNILFSNCQEVSPVIDHRGGGVSFIDCENISSAAKDYFVRTMGTSTSYTSMTIIDSKVTADNAAQVFNIESSYSSGVNSGGQNHVVYMNGSEISAAKGTVFGVTLNASEKDTSDKNNSNILITVENSVINANSYVVSTNLEGDDGDDKPMVSDACEFNVSVTVKDSKLISNDTVFGKKTSAKEGEYKSVDYSLNASVTDSYIIGKYLANNEDTLTDEALNLNLGMGTRVANNETEGNVTVTIPAGADYYNSNDKLGPKIVTDQVKVFTYLGGQFGGGTFEWYGGDDLVDPDSIPVPVPVDDDDNPLDIPTETAAYKYYWTYNEGSGYYQLHLGPNFSIKANLDLYGDVDMNIYIPVAVGEEVLNSITINGEAPTIVKDVVIDGVDYKRIVIENIAVSQIGTNIEIGATVNGIYSDTIELKKSVSVLDYAEAALKSESVDEAGKELVASLLNYISSVYTLTSTENDKLNALLSSEEYIAAAEGLEKTTEAEAGTGVDNAAIESVELNIGDGFAYVLKVKEGYTGTLKVSYYPGQQLELPHTYKYEVVGGEEIKLEIRAFNLIKGFTVTVDGETQSYNLANVLADEEVSQNEAATKVVEALWIYAEKALEYKSANME